MALPKDLSERIEILRLPLIIGVVFIHTYGGASTLNGLKIGLSHPSYINVLIQNYISGILADISVPLFFSISGYLYFYNYPGTKSAYIAKLKARFNSLLIPYLFWNIIVLILYFAAQNLPATSTYFSGLGKPILAYHVYDFINALGITASFPIAGQFWFIRALILLVIISPIIFFQIKYIPYIWLFFYFICWSLGIFFFSVDSSAFFFFFLGGVLGRKRSGFVFIDKYGRYFFVIYILSSIAEVVYNTSMTLPVFEADVRDNSLLHHFNILIGMCTVIYLAKEVVSGKCESIKIVLLKSAKYSFFVFAIHVLMLQTFKKVIYKTLNPSSDVWVIILYLFLPFIVIIVSIVVYEILSKMNHKILQISTGR